MATTAIGDLVPMEYDDYMDSWNYRLSLIVKNSSSKTVNIKISNLDIFVGDLSLDAARQIDDWHATIPAGGSKTFLADVKISPGTLERIRQEENPVVQARGNVAVSVEMLWMNEYREQFWNLAKPMKIY
jgi:hypothetical protein